MVFSIDSWKEIFDTMRRNRLRTIMTAFGVFWGIFILVILLACGNALEKGVSASLQGFGTNQIYVWGGRATRPYLGLAPGRRVRYDVDDISAVQDVDGVAHVAPRISLSGYRGTNNVSRNGKTGGFKVLGDYPAWAIIQPFEYYEGRFINELDIRENRKVAVIGEQVYDVLFAKGEKALGQSVLIANVYFEIVGRVHSTRTGSSADEDAQTIYIPFTTFQRSFLKNSNEVHWFAISAQEGAPPDTVDESVRAMLKVRKKIHPDDNQAVQGFNAANAADKVDRLFGGIRTFMWIVGLATLFSGMLGVSNIMLIVVRERTREIGIRKALGARPWSIISSVMQESIILTLLAGYAGLITAVAGSEFLGTILEGSSLPLGRPEVDFSVAVLALVILVAAGAVAGFIPARKAASVQPVHALRAR